MARTSRGNFVGRAARIDRLDKFQEDLDHRYEFQKEWFKALTGLQELDPDGWLAWYDSCPQQKCGDMLPLIKERIELLEQLEWLNESVPFTAV